MSPRTQTVSSNCYVFQRQEDLERGEKKGKNSSLIEPVDTKNNSLAFFHFSRKFTFSSPSPPPPPLLLLLRLPAPPPLRRHDGGVHNLSESLPRPAGRGRPRGQQGVCRGGELGAQAVAAAAAAVGFRGRTTARARGETPAAAAEAAATATALPCCRRRRRRVPRVTLRSSARASPGSRGGAGGRPRLAGQGRERRGEPRRRSKRARGTRRRRRRRRRRSRDRRRRLARRAPAQQ